MTILSAPGDVRHSSRTDVVLMSTAALVTAAVVTITVHELSHVVANLAYGTAAELRPNAARAVDPLAAGQQAVVAMTGPLASMAIGAAGYAVQRRLRPGYGRLLLLWVALTSAQTGFGYLLVAGALPAGDTGKAFEIWGVPAAGYLVAAVVGVCGQLFLSALMAREVAPWFAGASDLRSWVMLPWLFGTLVLLAVYTVASLGTFSAEELVAVLAGVATVAIFAPTTSIFIRRFPVGAGGVDLGSPGRALAGAAAAVAVVAVLALSGGVTIG